jgi:hypothetical protein
MYHNAGVDVSDRESRKAYFLRLVERNEELSENEKRWCREKYIYDLNKTYLPTSRQEERLVVIDVKRKTFKYNLAAKLQLLKKDDEIKSLKKDMVSCN